MSAISLKLPADLLIDVDRCAEALRLPRAEYIRRALDQVNRETQAHFRATRLRDASRRIRTETLRLNAEFAGMERDVDA